MTTAVPTEIWVLGLSVVLLLVHVFTQAGFRHEQGLDYLAGPRDEAKPLRSPVAGRAARALENFLETYPAFVALAVGLVVAGKAGGWGAVGAWIYLGARIVYLPLYLTGIPRLRSLAWTVSLIGLVVMLAVMLL